MNNIFPLPDAFWLLFFHVEFHIPGSQAAFVSSVYQVQELLELFSPVEKFFLPLFQKEKPLQTTKISLLCLESSFSVKCYRQFVHICS